MERCPRVLWPALRGGLHTADPERTLGVWVLGGWRRDVDRWGRARSRAGLRFGRLPCLHARGSLARGRRRRTHVLVREPRGPWRYRRGPGRQRSPGCLCARQLLMAGCAGLQLAEWGERLLRQGSDRDGFARRGECCRLPDEL